MQRRLDILVFLVLAWKHSLVCCSSAPGSQSEITPSPTETKSRDKDVSRPGNDKSSLIQAHAQYRTGLYTPNSLSENDAEIYPGLLKPFPELPNLILTNEGKAQMFKLGVFFQWWYGSVLNYTYNPLQYRMVSSTCVWNIESSNAVWAGMFPFDTNDTEKMWNPNLSLWPIPVHLEHRMARAFYEEKLPSWANQSIVRSSTTMYFNYLNMLAGFYDVLRISTSWWWELLLLEFNRAINGESQRKIVQYSSHNDMLVACLASITDTLSMWPDWGAGFSVELHKRNNQHIVEIWGWLNPNQPEPLSLNITDCPAPCSLQDFSRIVSKYHVTDVRHECGTVSPASGSHIPRYVFVAFVATLLTCLVSVCLLLWQYRKNQMNTL